MKNIIKQFIPKKLVDYINRCRIQKEKEVIYRDMLDWNFHFLLSKKVDSDTLLKHIMLRYHVIEKGLTMPSRRNGFGKEVLLDLISDINAYIKEFGTENEQIPVAIGVVAEYFNIHELQGYKLEEDVLQAIHSLLNTYPYPAVAQKEMDKEKYFLSNCEPFDSFSASRHSLRNFEGIVSENDLKNALQLAQNAPSACNRQATRIKIIADKKIISNIFSIHRGNRGFGHLANKLLVLTTDMRYWDIRTCMGGYVDGGIYAMNLLYALHFYKIGACPLNACFLPSEEKKIRKLIQIPDNENLVLFIAIGGVPEHFKLANSHRYNTNNIIKYI